ncbi:MAG TPA: thiamine pyrophosphate-dependent enzyme [Steroidobacteraceae bacterium]|jgi:thiamine pyrophosphate-dependent acetolactate synthase large subunit-like protein|nr:thiamine pyrophosphate-dependent enzyme [Steroidobacteraceae bacterium]
MADDPEKVTDVTRRQLLAGAALGGMVAAAAAPLLASAQSSSGEAHAETRDPSSTPPAYEPPQRQLTFSTCGGDYMTDVLRGLGIEYFAATPGNTFMGLHESILNYGMVTEPKMRSLLTLHEEASVAMCHGYAKIEGKPMACGMHGVVGLQHASMAIYNAYADRVPIFMITSASLDALRRGGGDKWDHSGTDAPAMVRDFTKWDSTPGSLGHFGEAATRAYKFAMTPPYGPVLLAVDTNMQEDEIPGGSQRRPPIPKLPRISPPAAEEAVVEEIADKLVNAENPVLYADRMARTPEGLKNLIELAETLQAPVCDGGNRMNFPWRHPLNQRAQLRSLLGKADVLLALEPGGPFNLVTEQDRDGNLKPTLPAGSMSISISASELAPKGNYHEMQRYAGNFTLAVEADSEATLPALIEAVKRKLTTSRSSALQARGQMFAQAHQQDLNLAKQAAAYGWDASPISMPRMCQELYYAIKDEDWSLVSPTAFQSGWPQKLWTADRHYQYIGAQGAAGIGYITPASLGAALANQKYGRFTVSITGDGDLMFSPGVLFTAAHERIPILYLVHNNRCYHEELMQLQFIANRRQRGIQRVGIACDITDPNISYADMARSMGVYGEGPIVDPKDLGPALKRAVARVKRGEPALIDVVSQGR